MTHPRSPDQVWTSPTLSCHASSPGHPAWWSQSGDATRCAEPRSDPLSPCQDAFSRGDPPLPVHPHHGPLLCSSCCSTWSDGSAPKDPSWQTSHCLWLGHLACASLPRTDQVCWHRRAGGRPAWNTKPGGPLIRWAPSIPPKAGACDFFNTMSQGLPAPGPCPSCPRAAWWLVLSGRELDRMGPVRSSPSSSLVAASMHSGADEPLQGLWESWGTSGPH